MSSPHRWPTELCRSSCHTGRISTLSADKADNDSRVAHGGNCRQARMSECSRSGNSSRICSGVSPSAARCVVPTHQLDSARFDVWHGHDCEAVSTGEVVEHGTNEQCATRRSHFPPRRLPTHPRSSPLCLCVSKPIPPRHTDLSGKHRGTEITEL